MKIFKSCFTVFKWINWECKCSHRDSYDEKFCSITCLHDKNNTYDEGIIKKKKCLGRWNKIYSINNYYIQIQLNFLFPFSISILKEYILDCSHNGNEKWTHSAERIFMSKEKYSSLKNEKTYDDDSWHRQWLVVIIAYFPHAIIIIILLVIVII